MGLQPDLARKAVGEIDVQRLAAWLGEVEARVGDFGASLRRFTDVQLAATAASLYRARRGGAEIFGEPLFGEPAWDMLLDLFVQRVHGGRVSTTSLCLAAEVGALRGLRCIMDLEASGLVERYHAADDRRVARVDLTLEGFQLMRIALSEGAERFGEASESRWAASR